MRMIVINGPMGVGKTTVGRYIADHHPGTALIDGDWCMDIHPFAGTRETKAMAVDNILHMAGNYMRCSACGMVVITWLMDDPWVIRSLTGGLAALGAQVRYVTLVCDEGTLKERWRNDRDCEWRTDGWLAVSLKSLPVFTATENALDTGGLSVSQIAEEIMRAEEAQGKESGGYPPEDGGR